jgi:SAM-dependent methyltransferase
MNKADSQTEQNQSISIKRAHEHYLDRWLGLYEYDEYRKWLFSGLLKTLKERIIYGSVLEIGCSKGYLSRLLDRNGYSCIGGDISKIALRFARNIKTVRLDGETLPFKNSSFDAILAISTIEHMPKPERTIKEVFRVLKNEGLFIAITPDKDSLLGKIGRNLLDYTSLKNPYHVGLMNKKELNIFLKGTGFKQFKIQPFHNGFFSAPFIKKILKRQLIPIPIKIPVPFSPHLIVIAHKNNQEKQEMHIEIEVPEMHYCSQYLNGNKSPLTLSQVFERNKKRKNLLNTAIFNHVI